jgi:hypothetical protein
MIALTLTTTILVACKGSNLEPTDQASDDPNTVELIPNNEQQDSRLIESTPSSEEILRDPVYMEPGSSHILLLDTYPVQVILELEGFLPTPCHKLQVDITEPDDQNNIHVIIYSLDNPNLEVDCIQRLEPFEERVELGTFEEGSFTVWVNNERFGEFSLP